MNLKIRKKLEKGYVSVFEGPATALYVPAGSEYRIIANSSLEVAIITASVQKRGNPILIKLDHVMI